MWKFVVLAVATFLTLYLGWRLINPASIRRRWKVAAWLAVALLLFGQRLKWLVRNQGIEGDIYIYMNWVGYTFLGFVSVLVILMLGRDIPVLVKRIGQKINLRLGRSRPRIYTKKADLERRRFLLNASNTAILTATLPLTGYSIFKARSVPPVVANDLSVIGLPQGLDGFTIAQISDTHIGPTIREDWLQSVVDEVNGQSPDLIVHTGDVVDGAVLELNDAVAPFANLSAPYGVWMCTGNHEYYSGVKEWMHKAEQLGMKPLLNEHQLIDTGQGRILLGGVTDLRGEQIYPAHKSSPQAAMANAPEHDVSILLAHQPRSIYDAEAAGFNIQLSGHTHGGQYFPYNFAVHLFQPYVRGLHLHGNTLLYVNVGTGYWGPPMRLGSGPEITLHTLRRA